ncbi:DNA adenine methylase [Caballeronia sp. DA-9]|uniref:DNA adenine methylase n=1 Tax=Caballeronia sp. DA-9 TaxID=3436237 RepID=UPI003F67CA28
MAQPIFPWLGGKRRLAPILLSRFPEHSCYVEVFAGAAAFFFLREPAEVEVLNDLDGDVINLYRVVQHHLEEFVRQFRWALSSRQVFGWLSDTPTHTLTDIQRAARFYYLQTNGFGGRVKSRTFGTRTTSPPSLNLLRLEETLSAAHLRLSGAYVENLDWQTCVAKYDRTHTFMYLDPPFWETEGYSRPFAFEEYGQMADILKRLKGRAIVSLNDHPEMRRLFTDFQQETVDVRYTAGGRGSSVRRTELIIYSWDRRQDPQRISPKTVRAK